MPLKVEKPFVQCPYRHLAYESCGPQSPARGVVDNRLGFDCTSGRHPSLAMTRLQPEEEAIKSLGGGPMILRWPSLNYLSNST